MEWVPCDSEVYSWSTVENTSDSARSYIFDGSPIHASLLRWDTPGHIADESTV